MYSGKTMILTPRRKDDKVTWEVNIHGIDLGGKAMMHSTGGNKVAIKVAGHQAWAGRGETRYEPAFYLILKVAEPIKLDKNLPTRAQVESFIHEFPVKADSYYA